MIVIFNKFLPFRMLWEFYFIFILVLNPSKKDSNSPAKVKLNIQRDETSLKSPELPGNLPQEWLLTKVSVKHVTGLLAFLCMGFSSQVSLIVWIINCLSVNIHYFSMVAHLADGTKQTHTYMLKLADKSDSIISFLAVIFFDLSPLPIFPPINLWCSRRETN